MYKSSSPSYSNLNEPRFLVWIYNLEFLEWLFPVTLFLQVTILIIRDFTCSPLVTDCCFKALFFFLLLFKSKRERDVILQQIYRIHLPRFQQTKQVNTNLYPAKKINSNYWILFWVKIFIVKRTNASFRLSLVSYKVLTIVMCDCFLL